MNSVFPDDHPNNTSLLHNCYISMELILNNPGVKVVMEIGNIV